MTQATLLQQEILEHIDSGQGLCPCGRNTGQIPDCETIGSLDQTPATCLDFHPGVIETQIWHKADGRIPTGQKHRANQVLVRIEARVVSNSVTGAIEKMLDVAAPRAVIHHPRNPLTVEASRETSETENLVSRKDLINACLTALRIQELPEQ